MGVKTTEKVRGAIARAGEEISEKAWTVGRDKKAERRKRIAWGLVQGGVAAVFTLVARRTGAKVWGVLTGEAPPAKR
ncbi:MAG: hypothetical protein ABUS54_06955 [Actinomycetota bacterium]